MIRSLSLTFAALILGACASSSMTKLDENAFEHYAKGVHSGDVVAVSDVMSSPETYAGDVVRVRGDIVQVCPKKGCWVEIGTEAQPLFAKFEQCDSYLPLDLGGELIVEGKVMIEEVSVEEQKHLLEDAGKHEEAMKIMKPATKVRFMASGAARQN